MNLESFDTIMARNNTTLPQNTAGYEEKDAMRTAAVQSEKSHRKNTAVIVAFSVVLLFCLLSTAGAAAINKRAAPSTTNDHPTAPVKLCHQNTPCGWAIYIPFTRRIDYFMKNTCECGSSLACLKTDDDLSVNAYVYRCKPRPASTTTDLMPTEDDSVPENNDNDD